MARGYGYIGSPNLMTSTENMEIFPPKPPEWTLGYQAYQFSFYNDNDAFVKINNGDPIFIRGGQGFSMDRDDKEIYSFIIVNAGVTFNYVFAY